MKVVLFCGGLGMRLREYSETVPKPLVNIGFRPILWHVMKYYAYYGHKDFILCLGYRGDQIKNYFRSYDECLNSDIHDWNITFADTGITSSIGQRLRAVRKYVEGEECFLANYTDGLSDLPLPALIDYFHRQDKIGCFLSVKANLSCHFVTVNGDGKVSEIIEASKANVRVNGGFFVFKRQIFDYIHDGDDLVGEPFQRLIREDQLVAYHYDGFSKNLDTFKDKQQLDELYSRGSAPWEAWKICPEGK